MADVLTGQGDVAPVAIVKHPIAEGSADSAGKEADFLVEAANVEVAVSPSFVQADGTAEVQLLSSRILQPAVGDGYDEAVVLKTVGRQLVVTILVRGSSQAVHYPILLMSLDARRAAKVIINGPAYQTQTTRNLFLGREEGRLDLQHPSHGIGAIE